MLRGIAVIRYHLYNGFSKCVCWWISYRDIVFLFIDFVIVCRKEFAQVKNCAVPFHDCSCTVWELTKYLPILKLLALVDIHADVYYSKPSHFLLVIV